MFSKWELVEEGKIMEKRMVAVAWGYESPLIRCVVDVYRKKRWNGIYKYKYVERK